jgi:hypothetical protein
MNQIPTINARLPSLVVDFMQLILFCSAVTLNGYFFKIRELERDGLRGYYIVVITR